MSETLGQYRVGVSFNPSNNTVVDEIKMKAAELIDLVGSIEDPAFPSLDDGISHYSEVARLRALAQTHIETAAMYAVKAATKPEPK